VRGAATDDRPLLIGRDRPNSPVLAADSSHPEWRHALCDRGSIYLAQLKRCFRPVAATIATAAQQIRHSSAFALSATFKRVRGVTPKDHRAAVAR
jgi:AraC-like DNA-binding protein